MKKFLVVSLLCVSCLNAQEESWQTVSVSDAQPSSLKEYAVQTKAEAHMSVERAKQDAIKELHKEAGKIQNKIQSHVDEQKKSILKWIDTVLPGMIQSGIDKAVGGASSRASQLYEGTKVRAGNVYDWLLRKAHIRKAQEESVENLETQ